jgi:hypothetical protein
MSIIEELGNYYLQVDGISDKVLVKKLSSFSRFRENAYEKHNYQR